MGPRRVLVTFGTKEYVPAMELLRHSAMKNAGFDKVVCYDETTIPNRMGPERHGSYVWKPSAILKAMRLECCEGDLLVWADSTMCFGPQAGEVWAACTEPVNCFCIGDAAEKQYTIERYTKPSCLDRMGVGSEDRKRLQVSAALQAYRKCPDALAFLREYETWCGVAECVQHDSRHPSHRHDQSVLSILAHRSLGVLMHADPTQWGSTPAIDHHRRVLRPMQTLVVVTPTTGRDLDMLRRCLDSVQVQDVICLRHLVVCDGPAASHNTRNIRDQYKKLKVPVAWLDLPYNTGGGQWNGHRVYGTAAFLAQSAHATGPAQLVAFLDEDNWFEEDHLRRLLGEMTAGGHDAVHSLRNIWEGGSFICPDNCESLGRIAPSSLGNYYLADTSTWLIKQRAAVLSAHCWDVKARDPTRPEADRALTTFLMSNFSVGTVRRHTLNYTANSGPLSVTSKFFLSNNRIDGWDFAGRQDLYLFHMSAEKTLEALRDASDGRRSHMLDEWNLAQVRSLWRTHNLINGYKCLPHIPKAANVLVHMCIPDQLPLAFLRDRPDLNRVVYTAESPNIRHQQQWGTDFLGQVADHVLTFWKPLLAARTTFATYPCPHNCHYWDADNPHDRQQLRQNTGEPGTVCMVLENRQGVDEYDIDGVRMQCLDGLRQEWARAVGSQPGLTVTVHGQGWQPDASWQVQSSRGKYGDPMHAVDILQGFSAALIVENCNAEGYVSEKFYDALMAGCVPIFYNRHREDVVSPDISFNLAVDEPCSITPAAIQSKRGAVLEKREQILRGVGCQAYAGLVERVLYSGQGIPVAQNE